MKELERTINKADCDVVLIGTPIDLGSLLKINKPHQRVRYELGKPTTKALREEIEKAIQ
jgi:predicted GTPase